MTVPRICALAEVAWSPPQTRGLAGFRRRLEGEQAAWKRMGVNYRRPASSAGGKRAGC
jgi:hypothetical protein